MRLPGDVIGRLFGLSLIVELPEPAGLRILDQVEAIGGGVGDHDSKVRRFRCSGVEALLTRY